MPFKRKLRRKLMDSKRTLNAFECRLMCLPEERLRVLEGKWLSSHDIYDTILRNNPDILERYQHDTLDSHIWRLAHVCIQRNIKIKGITSARIVQGKRIAALPENELQHIIHVGRCNNFRNLQTHPEFGLLPQDKRFLE